jgi:predicted ATPase with chaperone activity
MQNGDRISWSMPKKKSADKRSRRAHRTTELKTEAIERLEKLATDLADVTAEASAVAEIVREGLEVEETNQAAADTARPRKPKQIAR